VNGITLATEGPERRCSSVWWRDGHSEVRPGDLGSRRTPDPRGAIPRPSDAPGDIGRGGRVQGGGRARGGDNATAHWVKIQLSTDGPFAASATILMPRIDLVVEDEGGD